MKTPLDERARLLGEAAALIRESKGFSVAGLAERVGLSRAAVYRLVGGHEAILGALRAAGQVDEGEAARTDARERILDAMTERLRTQRFGRLTVEEIAGEAGVSAMTVYRHFGDRPGLLRAFMEERSPRGDLRALLKGIGNDEVPEVVLTALARRALGFAAAFPHIVRMLISPDPEEDELLRPLRNGGNRGREALASYLDAQMQRGRLRHEDAALLAELFVGMVVALALKRSGPGDLDAAAGLLVRTFLEGHATRGGGEGVGHGS
ncbi:TetR/AcrR family transcriptional regulator [Chondromyces crocatus]|uniref:HTH tetR-type domain-containing protein n=1 Tax=Chondromyces crocatus TaxID=52 RepID=A0A0K1ER44_CHOCO|nr:TetR/AcrR family transcriptional regulator [Chondromyces crocatus]AKT43294.1 uncharacterized protein CMC5_075260 [Chondromyces crocatus]